MSTRIINVDNYGDWINSAAEAIFNKVLNCGSRSVNIALSGGKSPRPIYEKLASLLFESGKSIEIKIFLVDERNVSINNDLSNSKLLLSIFPKHVVFPFDPFTTKSKDYWELIQKNLYRSKFDVVVLGCGEDGHIASVFPKSELNIMDSTLNEFVTCNTEVGIRHTLTLHAISEARHKIITINKNQAKQRFFNELKDDEYYPVNKIKGVSNTQTIINI